jgi:hypothetical protein
VGKDRARCLIGPFPHPPRENRAYGFHHTTAHARRASIGSSFAGLSRCIPPDYHPVSRLTTTASRLRCFPLYAALPRSSGGASLPRVLPPIRRLTYAGFWSLLGAFPRRGASHFGVCSGSGFGGFGQGLPEPTHRSPWHPVQGFPCPLRWTLQRGLGGGSLPIPTALCGSQPGRRYVQVGSSRSSSMPM